jgi:hypothetical protein
MLVVCALVVKPENDNSKNNIQRVVYISYLFTGHDIIDYIAKLGMLFWVSEKEILEGEYFCHRKLSSEESCHSNYFLGDDAFQM